MTISKYSLIVMVYLDLECPPKIHFLKDSGLVPNASSFRGRAFGK